MSSIDLPSKVGPIGFGLMGFTWRPVLTPDEQAFKTIKSAIGQGATFFNAGEFYGTPPHSNANLELINRYFTKYPEDAKKIVLSVKGCVDFNTLAPQGDKENISKSINNILSHLNGNYKFKKFIFEPARIDSNVSLEETIGAIADFVKDGRIDGISLSEVGAQTIRKASLVYPISAVEVEFSLWSTEILTNGVLDVCKELNIPIVAYSPLGRGFLTGQIQKLSDIPEGDFRRHFDRFQPENFDKNLELVAEIKKLAKSKNISAAQLALAWVLYQGKKLGVSIIPIPGATTSERVEENTKSVNVSFTDDDGENIDKILSSFSVSGGRYNEAQEAFLFA